MQAKMHALDASVAASGNDALAREISAAALLAALARMTPDESLYVEGIVGQKETYVECYGCAHDRDARDVRLLLDSDDRSAFSVSWEIRRNDSDLCSHGAVAEATYCTGRADDMEPCYGCGEYVFTEAMLPSRSKGGHYCDFCSSRMSDDDF